jgi:DNA-binding IclR family transcriptional regulator
VSKLNAAFADGVHGQGERMGEARTDAHQALACDQPADGHDGVAPSSMIERMTLIMEAFDHPLSQLTLEEVSSRAGLPRSTTHRILDQLVRSRWLKRSGMSYYRLGSRALKLGGRWGFQSSLREAAAPHLHDLATRTDMVAHVAILKRTEICFLDAAGARARLGVPTRVGWRLPAHCTALGKAMLASLEPEEIDTHYAQVMTRCTTLSVPTLAGLHRELGQVRTHNGLAVDRGECFANLGCVAMALRGPIGTIGAVSVACHPRNLALDRVAPMVATAARKIESDLCASADLTVGCQLEGNQLGAGFVMRMGPPACH